MYRRVTEYETEIQGTNPVTEYRTIAQRPEGSMLQLQLIVVAVNRRRLSSTATDMTLNSSFLQPKQLEGTWLLVSTESVRAFDTQTKYDMRRREPHHWSHMQQQCVSQYEHMIEMMLWTHSSLECAAVRYPGQTIESPDYLT